MQYSITLIYISWIRTSKKKEKKTPLVNIVFIHREGFKYIGYKKVIKKLVYFFPQSVLMKMYFLTSFTQYRLRL